MRHHLSAIASPQGVRAFLSTLPEGARLLDVGCGNNSPYRVKSQRPDVNYVGLDVGNYNQTMPVLADRYVVVPAEAFVGEIVRLAGTMDAVISSHNIEHCDDPKAVVRAMGAALKPGGRLYMSFPGEQSIAFPSRGGCLNFFDDPTHRAVPAFGAIAAQLREAGLDTVVATRRYRPPLLWLVGAVMEPLSRLRQHIVPGTWAFYGFESVIWARKS